MTYRQQIKCQTVSYLQLIFERKRFVAMSAMEISRSEMNGHLMISHVMLLTEGLTAFLDGREEGGEGEKISTLEVHRPQS